MFYSNRGETKNLLHGRWSSESYGCILNVNMFKTDFLIVELNIVLDKLFCLFSSNCMTNWWKIAGIFCVFLFFGRDRLMWASRLIEYSFSFYCDWSELMSNRRLSVLKLLIHWPQIAEYPLDSKTGSIEVERNGRVANLNCKYREIEYNGVINRQVVVAMFISPFHNMLARSMFHTDIRWKNSKSFYLLWVCFFFE